MNAIYRMGAIACVLGGALLATTHGESSKSSDEPHKFDTPIWNPKARWQIERFAGCDARGHLDGPRLEMESFSPGVGSRAYQAMDGGGRYGFGCYDPGTGRGHLVAGSARGYLDGPFSRARFGGWDYVVRGRSATSPEGRYYFFTDGYNGHVLRRLDYEKQEVQTLLADTRSLKGMVPDSKGRLWLLKSDGELICLMPDGKAEKGTRLSLEEKIGAWGVSLAIDEKNARIYATTYGAAKWHVWFWDLKDGSFHGVLPIAAKDAPQRARNEAGPFEGVNLYNEGSVSFGPDDPDYRFLYVGRIDTWTFFRLDLKERHVWVLSPDGKNKGWEGQVVRFIDKGAPSGQLPCFGGGRWEEGGSFLGLSHSPFAGWRFKRIE